VYNENRPYRDQVRPFGFMLSFQALPPAQTEHQHFELDISSSKKRRKRRRVLPLKPIAPYSRDIVQAAKHCFDRETGSRTINPSQLKNYLMALAQYHLSPESKFLNGEPYDRGPTQRRHIEVIAIDCIGKEANQWEQQSHLGISADARVHYGISPQSFGQLQAALKKCTGRLSQRDIAKRAGISRTTLSKIMRGKPVRSADQIIRIVLNAIRDAEQEKQERGDRQQAMSGMRPKEQWLGRYGGLRANESSAQLHNRMDEIDRLETLFWSGMLSHDELEPTQRRLCQLKGIDFDSYDPPDD
jgi:transcriptional regulator with XRE-family HTH domain